MSKRTLGVVFFPAFDWAISPTHPEREERLLYTQDQLREEGLFDLPGITEYKPGVATYEDIERVHFCLPDVGRVCSASHLASAGGAIRAGELVLSGERERAFALVRPPGHHAMRGTHGNRGFCNVNMEAVMIENLRRRFGPLRVAIVDTDCHHGDGTQDIYWNDPDTLFISMHQDGRTLYPGTGIVIADLTAINDTICSYFVICQGNSPSQVTAIVDSVKEYVHKEPLPSRVCSPAPPAVLRPRTPPWSTSVLPMARSRA